ncbi:hypothetical protein ACT7DH_05720 [Bacillus pacificus]
MMKENTKELFSWAKTIGFTLVLIAIIRGVLFTIISIKRIDDAYTRK